MRGRKESWGWGPWLPYVKPHGRTYLDSLLLTSRRLLLLNMFGRGRLQDQTWLIGEITTSMEQIKSTNHLLIRKQILRKGSPAATYVVEMGVCLKFVDSMREWRSGKEKRSNEKIKLKSMVS